MIECRDKKILWLSVETVLCVKYKFIRSIMSYNNIIKNYICLQYIIVYGMLKSDSLTQYLII